MIDIPPQVYLPYDGPVIELQLPLQRVKTMCYVLGVRGKDVLGCGGYFDGGCLVVIPEIGPLVSDHDQRKLRKHELAHCNGWKHP